MFITHFCLGGEQLNSVGYSSQNNGYCNPDIIPPMDRNSGKKKKLWLEVNKMINNLDSDVNQM